MTIKPLKLNKEVFYSQDRRTRRGTKSVSKNGDVQFISLLKPRNFFSQLQIS